MTREFVSDGVFVSLLLCESVKKEPDGPGFAARHVFDETTLFVQDAPLVERNMKAIGMIVFHKAPQKRYEIEIVSWHQSTPDRKNVEHVDAVVIGEGAPHVQHPIGTKITTNFPPGWGHVGVMVNRRLRAIASFLAVPSNGPMPPRSDETPRG